MTTFRAFLRIIQKNIVVVITSLVILVIFGGFSLQATEGAPGYTADKPNVTIINHDEDAGITKALREYLGEECEIVDLPDDEEKLKDALFYRDTDLIIYIPSDYNERYANGESAEIEYRGSGDYASALAKMVVERFLRVADVYRDGEKEIDETVTKVKEVLAGDVNVEVLSHLDTASVQRAERFFNFESYALLYSLVFVIAIVMAAFNNKKVRQRLLVSSTDPAKQSRMLLWANWGFAVVMWKIYLIVGTIILGTDVIFSLQGVWFVLNSFIFMVCATALAFMVGSALRNKDAINGLSNVVALGSSFLCGVFVPLAWLPDGVRVIAHALPTYYYIMANEKIAQMEVLDGNTLRQLLINMGIMLIFAIVFVIVAIIVARKRKD